MPFRNRSNMSLRPVHRIKHVVDSQDGLTLANLLTKDLIVTVDAPVLATTNQVETGSKVNGIYLRVEIHAITAGALPNAYLAVFKNPGDNLTPVNPNVVGASDLKKYYIHQEMVMLQKQVNGNPRTLFNGVIAIPRGYRRNGPADKLQLLIFSPGVDLNVCVQCHYKEFR